MLKKFGIDYVLIEDLDSYNTFPSRHVKKLFQGKRKFEKMMNEIRPDAVFIDSPHYFGFFTPKIKIPMFMYLRGDY